jgi:protein-disulfide isomerase
MQKHVAQIFNRLRRRRLGGLKPLTAMAAVAAISLTSACRQSAARPTDTARQSSSRIAAPDEFGTIGGEKITIADIRAKSGDQLDKLETQYQLAKSRIISAALDSVIRDKTIVAEAQKQGKTVDQLIVAEAGPAGIDPSEVEIAAWYKENQARVGNRSLDQVKPQIASFLRDERRKSAGEKLEQRLIGEKKVVVTYDPYRLQFNNAGAPTEGPNDAPVTLVEFSDFQCPYCKGVAPALKEVERNYAKKVRIIYRQYPIPSLHPYAPKAAEASLCANEQGKFWEMHDAMFDDQTKLGVSDLKQTSRRLGMDGKKFDSCLDSGKYVEQIQNDQKEGQRSGVNGTPAIFINGVYVDGGAVPYSVLASRIDKELNRAK